MVMDIDFIAEIERRLDDYKMRIEMLESALSQLPNVNMQPDPSRPQGVTVAPLPKPEVPNG